MYYILNIELFLPHPSTCFCDLGNLPCRQVYCRNKTALDPGTLYNLHVNNFKLFTDNFKAVGTNVY